MTEKKVFEIYLYIEINKFKIFLLDTSSLNNLYIDEFLINNTSNIDFDKLSKFLDDNIFKIEKLLNRFVEDIILIIDNNVELQTNISIKKKNINDIADQKSLNQALVELKDLFKENNKEQHIMHMIIENFFIDGKDYKIFIDNLKSEYLNLDAKFISLPNELIVRFNKALEKYQIKIKYFMSGKYLKNFLDEKDWELSLMAHKILNGYNANEIEIVPKIKVNKGFFEKFFHFFS
tara:strand:+ start:1685 stop:2386 length:702 start_codon:yes stop_codon:yes gene_type:complete